VLKEIINCQSSLSSQKYLLNSFSGVAMANASAEMAFLLASIGSVSSLTPLRKKLRQVGFSLA
jgi:hypothetical protein